MRHPTTRRGWQGPLLVFAIILVVLGVLRAGVAWGGTPTPVAASPLFAAAGDKEPFSDFAAPGSGTPVLSVSAKDLGDFALEPPTLVSPAAIVINAKTGQVLYERGARERRPMASTTKIMTAILVLENMDLSKSLAISRRAAETIEPKTWLKTGDVLTVEQLMYALLLRSSNSAAVALAEGHSGSVEAFVALMNAKAKQLGMDDTNFVNPNGLDKTGHFSTAADIAQLARYAMGSARFRVFVSTKSYTLPLPGRSAPLVFENTNQLLGWVSWVTGIKTGLTPKAEQCFVGSGTRDGISVISVVLGQPVPDLCFSESKALMEYGLSQYRYLTLMGEGVAVAEADVPYELDGRLALVTAGAVEVELYKDDEVAASIALDRPLVLPVAAGESFGRVVLTVRGETVGSVDLVADKSFGKTTLGSKFVYYWKRFGRWLGRVI